MSKRILVLQKAPKPPLAARVTYAKVDLWEREASRRRFMSSDRWKCHEQADFGGRGPTG